MSRDTDQRPLGAQMSRMLADRGVEAIFGIPGVHNVEMYRGIEQAGLRHILARHEQGAGFMADGHARATGRPGVAFVITGPGLTNILTALGQAASDHVPVLCISSCLDEVAHRAGQLHQMRDQRAAAETVCAWSHEARDAAAAYGLIDRALAEFAAGDRRPRHIQVPIAVLGALADPPPSRVTATLARDALPEGVFDAVLAAQRPLFVLGGGCTGAWKEARAALRALGAGSFVTYAGRGIVADDPLHFGSYLARGGAADVIASADMVVAVGTELSEVDLWRDALGHDGPLLRIDRDVAALARGPGETHLRCDAAAALAHLTRLALDRPAATGWSIDEVAQARRRWHAQVDAERPGIVPLCDGLRAVVPEDAMIYSDMTQFAYAAKEVWDMGRPGHWHHPYGFGTLGYALPAAIGGAVARPGRSTLVIVGDYGLQYTVQELGTAVELGQPLPILVWDNAKLGEIEDAMVRSQIAPNAVVARNPDFCALARAYGALAEEPQDIAALQQAVTRALAADRPTVIRMVAGRFQT